MSEIALRMEHVYKKFRKGELYNSLRDLIPALTGRVLRQQELDANDKRDFWALQDLTFEVKRGEAFGIIGHNGAGKSTALKILSRIMKPTRGQMVVNGRLSALIEVTAGFHQDLTGRENIYLNGTILGMSKREIAAKLDEIVAFAGLEEFIDTPVKRYSSGMYARLGFAVAAHVDPEVLIVDEVLSVGDYVFQQKCVERMKEVLRSGATVMFVSHNLKSVTEFCHRALLLEKGQTVMCGPATEVVSAYLHRSRERAPSDSGPVAISKVTVRDEYGESVRFQSGQKAWVDVEVTAQKDVEKLAVVLWFTDESQYIIFSTSTERLGQPSFSLGPGGRYRCSFELQLNMAHGTFDVYVAIHRYDIQKEYDIKAPATSIFVGATSAVRGAVNCFPKLVEVEAPAASGV